jgi:hypothetical protein
VKGLEALGTGFTDDTDSVDSNGDLAVIARSAIGIIETLRDSEIIPVGIVYLHELVDYIYQEAGGASAPPSAGRRGLRNMRCAGSQDRLVKAA